MKWHKRIARMFGYELIRRKKFPDLDAHLARMLKVYEIDLVLDVGANMGEYALGLFARGYRGDVMSFEPNVDLAPELERASEGYSNWRVHSLALGREDGEQELLITKKSALASFREPSKYSTEELEAEAEIERREMVPVRRLDDVLHEAGIDATKRNVLLKLDTQGYDLEVCGGAVRTLPHVSLVQTELSFIALYEGMPSYLDALKFFSEHSFTPSGLYPIWRDDTTRAIVEADCVLVNRALPPRGAA